MTQATDTTARHLPIPRGSAELLRAKSMLRPFHRAGYCLFPLAFGTKHARDKGWQTRTYATPALVDWLKRGGDLGICLGPTHLVLDADPRHFEPGDDPLAQLADDVGINLTTVPTVISGRGDGGRHLYFSKPAGTAVRRTLPGYPGLDIKTSGGLVVAPGSRHIATGGTYEVDPSTVPISEAPMAPEALLALLRRPDKAPRMFGGGELTVQQLERLLAVLDPRDYRDYSKWISFAAACHDATGGEGLDVWLAWAAQDEEYGEPDSGLNARAWESFTAGRAGGATYMSILWAVARAGRADLVHEIEPNLDLSGVPVREKLIIYGRESEGD